MEQRVCSFCGESIEPGTGLMFIKKDGSVYFFDRRRCKLSLLKFGRLSRRLKWTRHYPRAGAAQRLQEQAAAAAASQAEAKGKKGGRDVKVKPAGR